MSFSFFFFNDTATTEIYTLSLHDALPISGDLGWYCVRFALWLMDWRMPVRVSGRVLAELLPGSAGIRPADLNATRHADRKSTRLNSSHLVISYAGFCFEKKKKLTEQQPLA